MKVMIHLEKRTDSDGMKIEVVQSKKANVELDSNADTWIVGAGLIAMDWFQIIMYT